MQPESSPSIPLRNLAGETVAVAVVDASDHAWLSQWRWQLTPGGYAMRRDRPPGTAYADRKTVYMHRQVLGLGPGQVGDHINGDRLDNRRANLREATLALNGQNVRRGGSSRYRGVSWDKRRGKWQAYVFQYGRRFHLGTFDDEQQAAEAASAKRRELMPFAVEEG